MTGGNSLLAAMRRFGSSPEEICRSTLGIAPARICGSVILSPGWRPERMFEPSAITEVVQASPLYQYGIWEVSCGDRHITYLKTGFGAPAAMDAVLLLGLAGRCRKILFVSSTGSIAPEIGVGDIVLPEFAASGDGAVRYLSGSLLRDPFGERAYPDAGLAAALAAAAEEICGKNGVKWHRARVFCTDTIAAQYGHISAIRAMGYDTLDMESAAVLKAARLLGVPAAAILNVSDNSAAGKSLFTPRSGEEQAYRQFVRREVLPQILAAAI